MTRDTRTPVRRSNDSILRSACAAIAVNSATERARANSPRTWSLPWTSSESCACRVRKSDTALREASQASRGIIAIAT